MSARVRIGRPDVNNRRAVLVDGRQVGVIRPDLSGCSSPGGRGRHSRLAGWYVDVPPVTGEAVRRYRALRLADVENWARTSGVWPVQCWVYGSGSYGCLYNSCGCSTSRGDAIEALLELFELAGSGRKGRALARDGYVDLGRDYGADYGEVAECQECVWCSRATVRMVEEGWTCEECNSS